MLPRRIFLENFMKHSWSDIDLTGCKSAIIVGVDKNNSRESNGTGKTTIFRGVEFALYGTMPKGVNLDQAVRTGCDRCKVEFEFESNGSTYKVERSRSNVSNKSELKFWQLKTDEWKDVSSSTIAATEAELQKIIKISRTAFHNSVLFAQSDLSGLATANPKGRREILKEPLALYIYKKLEKIAKDRYNETVKDLEKNRNIVNLIGDPDADINAAQNELTNVETSIYINTTLRDNLQKDLSKKQIILSDLERAISSEAAEVHKKLSDVKSRRLKAEADLIKFKEELTAISDKIFSLNKQILVKREEADSLKQKLQQLTFQEARDPVVVRQEITELSTAIESVVGCIARDDNDLKVLQTPLPDGDVCDTCKQVITEKHRLECQAKTDAKIAALEEQIVKLRENLSKYRAIKDKLNKELKDISQYELDLNTVKSNINTKEELIASDQKLLSSFEDMLAHKQANIDSAKASLDDLNKQENELTEEAKKLSIEELSKDIFYTKSSIEQLINDISDVDKLITDAISRTGALAEKIDARNKDKIKLMSFKKECATFEKKADLQQQVLLAYSANGIPSLIINTILDDLQIEVNNVLTILRPNIQIQFVIAADTTDQEDSLEMKFLIDGVEREWELVSGGQKMFIAFALKLGLSKVIQHRLGVDIKFLELDEVDQSLDKAGVDALAEIIRRLDNTMKILVITHNDRLNDKFSHAILVEADAYNGAKANVVTSW